MDFRLFSLHASATSSFPTSLAIATQLALSSATIAFTPANSLIRLAALPRMSTCVYSVLNGAKSQMRGRWASLLGGASFMFLLQYLDVGLVRCWNWNDRGPSSPGNATSTGKSEKGEHGQNFAGHGVLCLHCDMSTPNTRRETRLISKTQVLLGFPLNMRSWLERVL